MSDAIQIDSIDDPRLAVYRNLKDRQIARLDGRFIAEGEHVVRRLLQSDFPVESVLAGRRVAQRIAPAVRPPTPLLVVPDELMNRIVGFRFHGGVIGCGRRIPSPPMEKVLPPVGKPSTLVICPDLISHENLGSLIRTAAALGVDAMILGPRCCDPFYRLSVRVSMGTIFRLPIVRSENLLADLEALRRRFGYELIATVPDDHAEPLSPTPAPSRIALMFGNEAQGLDAPMIAACDRRVRIPMRAGVDSLNISVAAGIFLHGYCRSDGPSFTDIERT